MQNRNCLRYCILVVLIAFASSQEERENSDVKDSTNEREYNSLLSFEESGDGSGSEVCEMQYSVYEKKYLRAAAGSYHEPFNRTSLNQCAERCCYETRFKCVAFNYFARLEQCWLMAVTQDDARYILIDALGSVHGELVEPTARPPSPTMTIKFKTPTFVHPFQSRSTTTTTTAETEQVRLLSTTTETNYFLSWYWRLFGGTDAPETSTVITTPSSVEISSEDIRLVGGNLTSGRVEVRISGNWGTICDDNWGLNDAAVVCRMLGFAGAVSAPQSAYFGPGTGKIHLDDVACSGSETSISDCIHAGWGVNNCGHNEDASVVCQLTATSTPGPATSTLVFERDDEMGACEMHYVVYNKKYLRGAYRNQPMKHFNKTGFNQCAELCCYEATCASFSHFSILEQCWLVESTQADDRFILVDSPGFVHVELVERPTSPPTSMTHVVISRNHTETLENNTAKPEKSASAKKIVATDTTGPISTSEPPKQLKCHSVYQVQAIENGTMMNNLQSVTTCPKAFICFSGHAKAELNTFGTFVNVSVKFGSCIPDVVCQADPCQSVASQIGRGVDYRLLECTPSCCDTDLCNNVLQKPDTATSPPGPSTSTLVFQGDDEMGACEMHYFVYQRRYLRRNTGRPMKQVDNIDFKQCAELCCYEATCASFSHFSILEQCWLMEVTQADARFILIDAPGFVHVELVERPTALPTSVAHVVVPRNHTESLENSTSKTEKSASSKKIVTDTTGPISTSAPSPTGKDQAVLSKNQTESLESTTARTEKSASAKKVVVTDTTETSRVGDTTKTVTSIPPTDCCNVSSETTSGRSRSAYRSGWLTMLLLPFVAGGRLLL